MGVEVIIGIVAIGIAVVSGGTSVGTIMHIKKKFKHLKEEKVTVDVENEVIDTETPNGTHRHIKKNSYHLEQTTLDELGVSSNQLETGRPNQVAESMASRAASGMSLLSTSEDGVVGFVKGLKSMMDSKQQHRIEHVESRSPRGNQEDQISIEECKEEDHYNAANRLTTLTIFLEEEAGILGDVDESVM